MPRGLSQQFRKSLEADDGLLNPFLRLVRDQDKSLFLGIREDYINIYHRGGNIVRIKRQGEGFLAEFDQKYLVFSKSMKDKVDDLPQSLGKTSDVDAWIAAVPYLKFGMDQWFSRHEKKEREIQHDIAFINNRSGSMNGGVAQATDYFVCDIEYSGPERSRFDIVAVRWPSTGPDRKKTTGIGLSIAEVKFGDGAISGKSGVLSHIAHWDKFLSSVERVREFKNEMKTVFNQLREFGLINCPKALDFFSDEPVECIIMLSDHDPAKSPLRSLDIQNLSLKNGDLKFATANFFGLGLYAESVHSPKSFSEKFRGQI